MTVTTTDKVVTRPIWRFATGIPELDWQFGSSILKAANGVMLPFWGLPMQRLSMLAGGPGVGKSRWAIQVTISAVTESPMIGIIKPFPKVLWFQNEVDEGQFKGWLKHNSVPDESVGVSRTTKLSEQIADIISFKPSIVFIDSVNMLDEYKDGRGGKEVEKAYRHAVAQVQCHVCFLGQYTTDGKIRGGTEFPHMVDVTCSATRFNLTSEANPNLQAEYTDADWFRIDILKTRCGPRRSTNWFHREDGVCSASYERASDPQWAKRFPTERQKILNSIEGGKSAGVSQETQSEIHQRALIAQAALANGLQIDEEAQSAIDQSTIGKSKKEGLLAGLFKIAWGR